MTMILLFICTCAYVREIFPYYINKVYHDGFKGVVRRAAVVGIPYFQHLTMNYRR